ncbi:hypothetical protein [Pelagicoccus sp. SDUM812002]|uniref:hypothetical protein n=1 Tax=Pelagicoccus sp. SDUM812002 TaxID=3041266 RepID=UPI002811E003|nr:hypothetical protein [Pelagicoccus sp. SDUM812002]
MKILQPGDGSTFDKANQLERPFKNDDPAMKRKIASPNGSQRLIPNIEEEARTSMSNPTLIQNQKSPSSRC